jgi:hypothetical protein
VVPLICEEAPSCFLCPLEVDTVQLYHKAEQKHDTNKWKYCKVFYLYRSIHAEGIYWGLSAVLPKVAPEMQDLTLAGQKFII